MHFIWLAYFDDKHKYNNKNICGIAINTTKSMPFAFYFERYEKPVIQEHKMHTQNYTIILIEWILYGNHIEGVDEE